VLGTGRPSGTLSHYKLNRQLPLENDFALKFFEGDIKSTANQDIQDYEQSVITPIDIAAPGWHHLLIALFMILNKVLKSPEAVEIQMKAGKKEFRIKKGNRRP
jgi:hypothetical protein